MIEPQHYLTPEHKLVLENELSTLTTVKRKQVLAALDFAKSLGDLSENAEYHQAREDHAKLENRIKEIEDILKNAVLVSKKVGGNHVTIGSAVTICKDGEKNCRRYELVGSDESDMKNGKLSYRSPLGTALMNQPKNASIKFQTPSGIVSYKIVEIK